MAEIINFLRPRGLPAEVCTGSQKPIIKPGTHLIGTDGWRYYYGMAGTAFNAAEKTNYYDPNSYTIRRQAQQEATWTFQALNALEKGDFAAFRSAQTRNITHWDVGPDMTPPLDDPMFIFPRPLPSSASQIEIKTPSKTPRIAPGTVLVDRMNWLYVYAKIDWDFAVRAGASVEFVAADGSAEAEPSWTTSMGVEISGHVMQTIPVGGWYAPVKLVLPKEEENFAVDDTVYVPDNFCDFWGVALPHINLDSAYPQTELGRIVCDKYGTRYIYALADGLLHKGQYAAQLSLAEYRFVGAEQTADTTKTNINRAVGQAIGRVEATHYSMFRLLEGRFDYPWARTKNAREKFEKTKNPKFF